MLDQIQGVRPKRQFGWTQTRYKGIAKNTLPDICGIRLRQPGHVREGGPEAGRRMRNACYGRALLA